MKHKLLLSFVLIFNVFLLNAQKYIIIETGLVTTGYNDVRIPGNGGTLLSLKHDLKPESKMFYRIRLQYTDTRHNFSLLIAPLKIKSDGNLSYNVLFDKTTFPAGNDLTATYKFNSYRLTYRYDFVQKPTLDIGLGITAKIRDAKITLESEDLSESYPNVGFVPLINFRVHWWTNEKLGFLLEGDALFSKQGRAEDVLLAVTYKLFPHLSVQGGYRLLEGGADNNKVYTFSMFHYASIGLAIYF